jgi:hypothetical protein
VRNIIAAQIVLSVPTMSSSSADLVVIGHHHPSSLQLLALLGAQQQGDGSNMHVWHVENKYYTAKIPCHAPPLSEADDCSDCEAMVMVFNPAKVETFKQVQAWYQKSDDRPSEIKLVVAMYEDAHEYMREGSRHDWLQAAEDWCTEEMIEYVELCSTKPEAVRSQSSEEGAQGLARVVEALQSHMWPSAEMRPEQSQQRPAATAAAVAAAAAAAQQAAASADTKELPDQLSLPEVEDEDDDATLAAFERLMLDMQGAQEAALRCLPWLAVGLLHMRAAQHKLHAVSMHCCMLCDTRRLHAHFAHNAWTAIQGLDMPLHLGTWLFFGTCLLAICCPCHRCCQAICQWR